jgi:hypothetical protein
MPPDWLPTPEAINALPEPLRRYIHDLETDVDPAGMVRENVMLRAERDQLVAKLAEQALASAYPGPSLTNRSLQDEPIVIPGPLNRQTLLSRALLG